MAGLGGRPGQFGGGQRPAGQPYPHVNPTGYGPTSAQHRPDVASPMPNASQHGYVPPSPDYASHHPGYGAPPGWQPPYAAQWAGNPAHAQPRSDKSFVAVLLLCLFLGGFGVHRFYVGKVGTGILTILTFFGFFGIWPTIDLIFIAIGQFKDSNGLPIKAD